MKELGEAIKAILDKIGVFLDLFDLSFFIAGATAIGALLFACYQHGLLPPKLPADWMVATGLIFSTYVAGMICFSLGRWARSKFAESAQQHYRADILAKFLKAHGVENLESIQKYLQRAPLPPKADPFPMDHPHWALHNRVWADLRDAPKLSNSLLLINRYWVMAASYDGLAVAILCWGVAFVSLWFNLQDCCCLAMWGKTLGTLAVSAFVAYSCWREAGRYSMHQLGELAATIAAAEFRNNQ
jgi:hypothetical protein